MANGAVYVVKGITFFLSHPSLWKTILCQILISFLISIAALVLLFIFALIPQAHLLENVLPDWLSWILAVLFVLLEIGAVILASVLILNDLYTGKLYNMVFELKGMRIEDQSTCSRSCLRSFSFTLFTAFLFIVTLPLNALPIIGTIVYFLINGLMIGWNAHNFYFETKDLSIRQQLKYVMSNWVDYLSFGIASIVLDLIPVFNFFLVYTNITGSVLWAVDLEQQKVFENEPHSKLNIPRGKQEMI